MSCGPLPTSPPVVAGHRRALFSNTSSKKRPRCNRPTIPGLKVRGFTARAVRSNCQLGNHLAAEGGGGIALGNFKSHAAYLLVDQAVCSEDDRATQLVGLSREVADPAASFLDQQYPGGSIPGLKPKFPKAIEAAGGNAGKIQGSRAIAAHAVRAQSKIPVVVNVRIGQAFVHRETRAKKTCRKLVHFRNENSLAVKRGPCAAGGGEQLVIERIVDHASEKSAALCKRDRYRKTRIAVRKIGRPVQRIHMPAKFRAAFMAGSFFRGDGVLRKILGQPSDNGLLGALIRLRDQINVALVRNLRRVIEFFAQNFPCFLGGFYGGFEIVFIHGKMMQPGACSV